MKDIDIIIVSERFGVLKAEDKIPYYPPSKDPLQLVDIKKAHDKNLKELEEHLQKYSDVFVVVGRKFLPLIEGFEKLTNANIEYASGPGLGPKAQHLKNWILGRNKNHA